VKDSHQPGQQTSQYVKDFAQRSCRQYEFETQFPGHGYSDLEFIKKEGPKAVKYMRDLIAANDANMLHDGLTLLGHTSPLCQLYLSIGIIQDGLDTDVSSHKPMMTRLLPIAHRRYTQITEEEKTKIFSITDDKRHWNYFFPPNNG
jgi:hypothetical protein